MSKFFVNKDNINGNQICITGEDVTHIKKVLRLKPGDMVTLCDGNRNEYLVRVQEMGQDVVHTDIVRSDTNQTEPSIEILLFQGIPKSDKMDLIIQKSVELGVHRIIPVITERTIVKIDGKTSSKKVSRWQRIALEAAKQSNRGIVPTVEPPRVFEEALEYCDGVDITVIPYEKEKEQGLKGVISGKTGIRKVAVFIGPEGGFSDSEIQAAIHQGVRPVTLGPRILRTETAGLAVLAIIMYELGDVGG